MIEVNGQPRLEHTYKFADFARAIAFTNKVAEAAEVDCIAMILLWRQKLTK
jgi:4a-hydroxytetrahydrobiopterin dehydratase